MNLRLFPPLVVLAVLPLAPAVTLRAQTTNLPADPATAKPAPAPSGQTSVERIVITGQAPDENGYYVPDATSATKTDTPLIETPQSVTIISQAQIEAQQAQSLNQALRYTPGVQSEQFGVDNLYDFFQIRGFPANANGVFRDGLQLNSGVGFASFRLEPYGAERIEVVRGPDSVLYGQTNPGGIVNYVSKLPLSERVQELEFNAGSFDEYQGKFDLTGPVAEEGPLSRLDYRLTGLVRESGTQIDYKPNDRLFLAPALTWHMDKNTTLTLLGQHQRDDAAHLAFLPSEGTSSFNPNGTIPINRFDGEPDFDHLYRTQYSAGYLFEHRFGDLWTVRQNLRFDHVDTDFQSVYGLAIDPDDPTRRILDRNAFKSSSNTDAFAVDTNVVGRFNTGPLAHTLLFGVDYHRYDFGETQANGDAPSIDIYAPHYGAPIVRPPTYLDSDSVQDQVGLYLQEQVKVYDRLVAVLSGREDLVSSKTKDRLANTTTSRDDHRFSGRAGLAYLFDFGLTPYLSYSESFLPVLGTNSLGQAFKPETGRQYEGGLKYQPPGWNTLLTLAAFNIDRQNVLTPDPDPTRPFNQVQTGAVRSRGVELGATATPVKGLNVVAAYAFQDVEITASNAGDEGKRPLATPEHLASLWADYTQPGGPLKGFGFGGGVRYQGSSFGDAANTIRSESFTVGDAVVHYERRGVRLAVNVQNVSDERYIAAITNGSSFYGAARTVIGSIRYTW